MKYGRRERSNEEEEKRGQQGPATHIQGKPQKKKQKKVYRNRKDKTPEAKDGWDVLN